ncbi:MAG: hypothetical protein M1834_000670 [Cirrosporium novae-zelandiae]|nr:MAG: hypothetical protein M1834_000670 [Cirrosporium novae-zelandiae]
MPKPKQFLKQSKGKKKKEQRPQTADEFLEVGVDFEEAGEKWRAGDAAKSTRFFLRAIDNYDQGLRLFPESFDLAYNKARVQYSLTQYPKLVAQLPSPLIELLGVALESHRIALHLQQDNADVLFNTAQALTSLAEQLNSDHPKLSRKGKSTGLQTDSQDTRSEALKLLQEALELFQRCLTLQEFKYTDFEQMLAEAQMNSENDIAPFDKDQHEEVRSSLEGSGDGLLATIEEPVTKDTLVDTACAQLEALTTLCETLLSDSGSGIAWIEEYSRNLLKEKIPLYLEGTDRQHEISIAQANFRCAFAAISYRAGRINFQTYENEIEAAYGEQSGIDVKNDPEALCDKADALLTLNSSVSESLQTGFADKEIISEINARRWKHLTSALSSLTTASKLQSVENLPKVHLGRGDIELLRFRLGEGQYPHKPAQTNAMMLLKNAQIYYRGAVAVAKSERAGEEEHEGVVKEAVAAALTGANGSLLEIIGGGQEQVMAILQDMVDDGLVDKNLVSP